jgi:hypothetical protein
MTDVPPPDLLDHRGRMNRVVAALAVGVALAVGAYSITSSLAGSDLERGNRGAGRFIFGFTGLAFAVGFTVTHAILVRLEKRRWRGERVPRAKVR